MKTFIKFAAIMLVFSACTKENRTDDVNPIPKIPPTALKTRVNQDNTFAFNLLRNTIAYSDKSNIVVSPISLSLGLGMTWNGANGDTKSEMETALIMSGLSDREINEYYCYMQTTLPSLDPTTSLSIANSIWYRTGFSVYPDFLERNMTYLNSEIRDLDFSQPNAKDIINNWCAQKTNNLIPEVLNFISSDAVMYLINAIYFKGTWHTQFDVSDTREDNFINEQGQQTKVNMMAVRNNFDYAEDSYAQYIDMPYGNKSFSMTVILPKQGVTTNDVLTQLSLESWNQRLQQLTSTDAMVYFPRFKVKQQHLLHENILPAMGMRKAFQIGADFSRLTPNSVCISAILHDTYIEVTEEGTEAAAVTTVEVVETSVIDSPQVFLANKPFLFVIREKSTGIILFIGKMGNVERY